MSGIIDFFFACCDDSTHPKKVVINGNTYTILEVIGEGGFGFVYRARDHSFGGGGRGVRNSLNPDPRTSANSDASIALDGGDHEDYSPDAQDRKAQLSRSRGDEVAIKRFLLTDAATPDERVRVLSEADNHRAASATNHKNIVRFIDAEVKHNTRSMRRNQVAAAGSSSNPNSTIQTDGAPQVAPVTSSRSNHHHHHHNGGHASMEGPTAVWVVMELCHGGSLQDAVNYNLKHGGTFGAHEILSIVLQCAAALKHMHCGVEATIDGGVGGNTNSSGTTKSNAADTTNTARRVVSPMAHWDVKLDNFLIMEPPTRAVDVRSGHTSVKSFASSNAAHGHANYTIRLCDFGAATTAGQFPIVKTAQEVSAAEAMFDGLMTISYRAPETLDLWDIKRHNEGAANPPPIAIDTKVDVWSLGVAIYILLFQEMPFEETTASVLSATPKYTVALPMWKRLDASVNIRERLLTIVLSRMLVKDPSKRADIKEVCALLCQLADDAQAPNPWLR